MDGRRRSSSSAQYTPQPLTLPVQALNETASIPDLPKPPSPKPNLSIMCDVAVKKQPLYAATQILICSPCLYPASAPATGCSPGPYDPTVGGNTASGPRSGSEAFCHRSVDGTHCPYTDRRQLDVPTSVDPLADGDVPPAAPSLPSPRADVTPAVASDVELLGLLGWAWA